ncbi:hypothetical protein [Parasediminibacterium sp. JCM 36343]|uniref:hypothetical protein n=1 Tax=Parasediminibacterium sp. JCM 36343 TaxID=3374279 RepID=UPI003978CCF5
MKSLVKTSGFKAIATLSIIIASQIGAFAASTTNTETTSLSTASAVGFTTLGIAVILAPLFKSATTASVKK